MRGFGSEDEIIAWLRRRLERQGNLLVGDDGALLPAGGPWAVTVDQQIAGVHFPPGLDEAVVARRLLAVNLSDLAALGARPAYALLALTLGPATDARRFFTALLRAADRRSLRLAGGDLARSDRFAASLTLVGTREPRGRWLGRRGARPGDRLFLGGPVGLSALGRRMVADGARISGRRVTFARTPPPRLAPVARRAVRRHLEPVPQLDLGRWLARRRRAAAIDLSDGLALDLHRLCRESGVGATVDAAAVAPPRAQRELADWLEVDCEALALAGGEDYVLLFSLAPGAAPPPHFGCRAIGKLTRAGVRLRTARGEEELPPRGWDHVAARSE